MTNKCVGLNCGKLDSKMQCPKCKELGINNSYFCNQDCFRKSWSTHKTIHSEATNTQLMKLAKALNMNDSKGEAIESGFYNPFPNHTFSGSLRPHYPLSSNSPLPSHIAKPDYAKDGNPRGELRLAKGLASVKVLNDDEINTMRKVSKLGRFILDKTAQQLKVGVTTDEVDKYMHHLTIANDAYPSPLNYHGYPKSVCTSVNEVICHGIPDGRKLKNGDIINLDISVFKDGFHTDLNATYAVGDIDENSKNLIETTRKSLDNAISICGPGVPYRKIGSMIQPVVDKEGYSVVRTYTGHGVGREFHQAPTILHHENSRSKGEMKVGQIFTIEPMVNASKSFHVDHWPDSWTAVTRDGVKSAQFEETILITENGCEVLTAKDDYTCPNDNVKIIKSEELNVSFNDLSN